MVWNKGLTKETDVRVAKCGQALSKKRKIKFWHNKAKIFLENRTCLCGCGFIKEVKINSNWKYKSGHNSKNRKLGTLLERFGIDKANKIKEKMRLKKIGKHPSNFGKKCIWVTKRNLENNCMKKKETVEKVKLTRKRTIFKSIIPCEERICCCGCNTKFVCKINSKQKYIYGHNSKCFSQEIRNKITTSLVNRIKFGNVIPSWSRCKHGKFYSNKNNKFMSYLSSYELFAIQILESLTTVLKYDTNFFCIPYIKNNKKHIYIVDLYVEYTNGEKQLIEIKPIYMLNDNLVKIKLEAGKKYAKENNMRFDIWTEKDLFNLKEGD